MRGRRGRIEIMKKDGMWRDNEVKNGDKRNGECRIWRRGEKEGGREEEGVEKVIVWMMVR